MLALLSGLGGGNFASSMSHISFFFPKRMQGLALGLNAGLGNFGVTTMQIVIPLVMTFALFGGAPLVLENTSGTLIGKIPAGTDTFIQNAGFIWLVFLVWPFTRLVHVFSAPVGYLFRPYQIVRKRAR